MKKYGFVYLWYDRKHKRYYVGSHWGTIEDGYICSSSWMKQAYKRRPQDFKRRILSYVYTNRTDLYESETRFLNMIKEDEIKVRYYNLNIKKAGHWISNNYNSISIGKKISKKLTGRKVTEEVKKKISETSKGKKISEKTKKKISQTHKERGIKPQTGPYWIHEKRSEEWKKNMSLNNIGNKNPFFGKTHSEETKRKMSDIAKNNILLCPHCKKTGGNVMKRWHFDNCKEKNK
jgi:hypothetical protein